MAAKSIFRMEKIGTLTYTITKTTPAGKSERVVVNDAALFWNYQAGNVLQSKLKQVFNLKTKPQCKQSHL